MHDLVIRGGTVVLEAGCRLLDVGVRDGQIVTLAQPGILPPAGEEIDASQRYVLPGGIDTHTHIRWPVGTGTSLDTFTSATRAAAASGTTTVLDFVPPTRNRSHLEAAKRRIDEAAGEAATDYSFHPILTDASPQTLSDIPQLIDLGLPSFKIFTTIDEFRLDDGEIRLVMEAIAGAGGLSGFHAENHALVETTLARLLQNRTPDIPAFPESRPGLAESAAIQLAALYARDLDTPLYIFHLSGTEGLTTLVEARQSGVRVQGETCTHYLIFDSSVYDRPDGWMYVITPPIRTATDREALWAALADQTIRCVGSDHCAYGLAQKRPGFSDFRAMPAGAPGIDARIPMLWTYGVAPGRLTPAQFADITATGPARTFGLYPTKGTIAVGSDADLVVLDPRIEWTWPAHPSGWGSDYDPYAGLTGHGLAVTTLLRGRVIARDGAYVGDTNHGQLAYRKIDLAHW